MNRILPYFIVNPNAGGRSGMRRWKAFSKLLNERVSECPVSFTESRGHAQVLAGEAIRKGFQCLVAFGGDGTLNEVLNGALKEQSDQQLTLGFVGAGSSNDFLREFAIDDEPFLDRLLSSRGVRVDAGKIECTNRAGAKIERYFLVNSTIGLVPEALRYFNEDTRLRRSMKRLSVDLAVVASGLSAVLNHRSSPYAITVDNERMERVELTNLGILKGSYFGGGMSYGFQGSRDDGLFQVVGIGPLSRARRLKAMLHFYRGDILKQPGVWRRTCKSVRVETNVERVIEADGELVGFLPASYSILPKAVTVIVGKRGFYA